MIKKSVDNAIFDAVLAKAFEDAAERDLAEMQTEDVPEYSEAYKKMERRYYNKVKRQSRSNRNRAGFTPVLKRVVSFVLIIGFVSCCVMLSAPTIRAEFVGLVTKFFDEYFSIALPSNATTYETEKFVFKYIPDTFTITDIISNTFMSKYSFISDRTDCYFNISIYTGTTIISQLDSSYSTHTELLINNNTGYLITSQHNQNLMIIWTDNKNMYTVSGNLSDIELTKIAKNIFPKEAN